MDLSYYKAMSDEDLKKIQKLIKNEFQPVKSQLDNQSRILEQHTESLLNIESTIKVYGDMYKMKNDNAKKLEKRTETLEEKAGITPPTELTLTEIN